jgi:hypothetical protein
MGRSPPNAAAKSAAKSGKAQPLALAKNVLPLVLLKPQSKDEAPPAEEFFSDTPKPVDASAAVNTAMTDSAQPAFVAELAALRTQNAALSEQVGGSCVAADPYVLLRNCSCCQVCMLNEEQHKRQLLAEHDASAAAELKVCRL